MDYNPSVAPFDLPVQQLIARCLAERPFFLPPQAGATPSTTLWGTFGEVLLKHACIRRVRGLGACINHNAPCLASQDCLIPWLYEPYSSTHRRNLPRPVLLHARALEDQTPIDAFDLNVVLLGRHAIAARESVKQMIRVMGAVGLEVENGRVRFQVAGIKAALPKTLAERAAAVRVDNWDQVLLVFETPFLHRESVEIAPGIKWQTEVSSMKAPKGSASLGSSGADAPVGGSVGLAAGKQWAA
jgi:hypothetical protein